MFCFVFLIVVFKEEYILEERDNVSEVSLLLTSYLMVPHFILAGILRGKH